MYPRLWGTSCNGLIRYVSLTKSRLNETIKVIRKSYFMKESISVAVGLSEHPEAIRELDELIISAANDGVSLLAIEHTGKVIGCSINKIYVKEAVTKRFFEGFTCQHPSARNYLQINRALGNAVNLFDLLQTNCYFECVLTGILPEYRSKGIGQKLQETNFEIVKRLVSGENVKASLNGQPLSLHPIPTAIMTYPTSDDLKKAAEKVGYKKAVEINFSEHLKDKLLSASILSKIPPVPVVYKHLK